MSELKTEGGIVLPPSMNPKTLDGLVNVVSGLGTAKAKRQHNTFQYDLLNNFLEYDAAYQSNWIVRNIVDVPAEDMTREWRTIKAKRGEDIQREEDRLGLRHISQDAMSWARLFGGAGVLMLTGQDLSKPLDLNKVKKGDLERMLVFDRWELQPLTINTWDVLALNYLMPEFYTLQGGHQSIHWSHVARFHGAKLPRRQMAYTQGWGDSELRKCLEDIKDTVSSKNGIAELMQEANVDVIKREGLSDELSTDQDEVITQRYAMFSKMKSIVNLALLDGTESYERKTLNMSGVAPTLETFMLWLAGCAGMPHTKLFGDSASGLNATGEGDERNYNNRIRSNQNCQLASGLATIDQVLVRSALGSFPDDYDYVWNPLSEADALKTAQAEEARQRKNIAYLESGVVTTSQIQRNLQANEEYQWEEGVIDDLAKQEETDLFDLGGDVNDAGSVGFSSVKPPRGAADAIAKHLRDIGIEDAINPEDLHVTLMYSPDSALCGSPDPRRNYWASQVGEPEIMGTAPWRALVMHLDSPELLVRHNELKDAGGIPTYPEYKPHISLKYDPTEEDLKKLKNNPIYLDRLMLTNEAWEPVK